MTSNQYLLSVCITSYNRINELRRCLYSIDSCLKDQIEVVVSEDCSPQKENIALVVEQYAKTSPFHVVFNSNEQNLGYDRNLKKLMTLASGEYILFLSDDDCFFPGKMDEFLSCLENNKPAMAYGAFWYGYREAKRMRRKYVTSHVIPPGLDSVQRRIYDAILFSGLMFKRSLVVNIDVDRFVNTNYFQVFMFMTVLYNFGGYYQNTLLIDSVSDGENAYGLVQSSGQGNRLLADRESVFSNLEFNKGLFKVIQSFDKDYEENVFSKFCKEYSLRSFGGFSRAREHGLKIYMDYWNRLKTSGIIIHPICYIYLLCVGLLGSRLSGFLFAIPKKILISRRMN
ncbi:MAG: glycosyltransferase family 2 protein [Prevotella sp.]|nr:glycosyltransferase family 2 protein [Prevotella sp.]